MLKICLCWAGSHLYCAACCTGSVAVQASFVKDFAHLDALPWVLVQCCNHLVPTVQGRGPIDKSHVQCY